MKFLVRLAQRSLILSYNPEWNLPTKFFFAETKANYTKVEQDETYSANEDSTLSEASLVEKDDVSDSHTKLAVDDADNQNDFSGHKGPATDDDSGENDVLAPHQDPAAYAGRSVPAAQEKPAEDDIEEEDSFNNAVDDFDNDDPVHIGNVPTAAALQKEDGLVEQDK